MTSFFLGTASKGMAVLLAIASFYGSATAAENAIGVSVLPPGYLQHPEPETAPGGTVVLRGSPANSIARPPATETNGWSGYYRSTFGYTRYYGVDQGFNGNFDNSGFDRHFAGSGLTR